MLHITHIVLHCVASSNEVYQKVAAGPITAEIAGLCLHVYMFTVDTRITGQP